MIMIPRKIPSTLGHDGCRRAMTLLAARRVGFVGPGSDPSASSPYTRRRVVSVGAAPVDIPVGAVDRSPPELPWSEVGHLRAWRPSPSTQLSIGHAEDHSDVVIE